MYGKIIDITIGTDAEVKIDAQGFSGTECETATQRLEERLGTVEDRTFKPEHGTEGVVLDDQHNELHIGSGAGGEVL